MRTYLHPEIQQIAERQISSEYLYQEEDSTPLANEVMMTNVQNSGSSENLYLEEDNGILLANEDMKMTTKYSSSENLYEEEDSIPLAIEQVTTITEQNSRDEKTHLSEEDDEEYKDRGRKYVKDEDVKTSKVMDPGGNGVPNTSSIPQAICEKGVEVTTSADILGSSGTDQSFDSLLIHSGNTNCPSGVEVDTKDNSPSMSAKPYQPNTKNTTELESNELENNSVLDPSKSRIEDKDSSKTTSEIKAISGNGLDDKTDDKTSVAQVLDIHPSEDEWLNSSNNAVRNAMYKRGTNMAKKKKGRFKSKRSSCGGKQQNKLNGQKKSFMKDTMESVTKSLNAGAEWLSALIQLLFLLPIRKVSGGILKVLKLMGQTNGYGSGPKMYKMKNVGFLKTVAVLYLMVFNGVDATTLPSTPPPSRWQHWIFCHTNKSFTHCTLRKVGQNGCSFNISELPVNCSAFQWNVYRVNDTCVGMVTEKQEDKGLVLECESESIPGTRGELLTNEDVYRMFSQHTPPKGPRLDIIIPVSVLCAFVLALASWFLYRWCKKKRATKTQPAGGADTSASNHAEVNGRLLHGENKDSDGNDMELKHLSGSPNPSD